MYLIPQTFCDADALLNDYLTLLLELRLEIDVADLKAAALTASTTTLAVLGAALLFARIIGGERWILSMISLVAGLAGAATANEFLRGAFASLFDATASTFGLTAEYKCVASMVILLLAGLSAGSFATKVVGLALWGVGALGVGYGAWLASGVVVPYLSTALAPDGADPIVIAPMAVYAGVGVCAFIGGYLVNAIAPGLIDLAVAFVGAFLLSHAALQTFLANEAAIVASVPALAALKISQYYIAYLFVVALALLALRSKLVKDEPRGRNGDSLIMR